MYGILVPIVQAVVGKLLISSVKSFSSSKESNGSVAEILNRVTREGGVKAKAVEAEDQVEGVKVRIAEVKA